MFKLFRSNPVNKLRKKYESLMKEAFELSKINRKLSDEKYEQAEKIMKKIKSLKA